MKISCNRCREFLDENLFSIHNKEKRGRNRTCKKCLKKRTLELHPAAIPRLADFIDGELWLSVSGFEGYYEISSLGRIRSVDRMIKKMGYIDALQVGMLLFNTVPKNNRYVKQTLCKEGKRKSQNLHILVAKAFITNPENKPFVNHRNGIKYDNRVDNLEWVTASENTQHAIDNKLLDICGENCNLSKLSNNQAKEIQKLYESKPFFETDVDFGRRLQHKYPIKVESIVRCAKKLTYSKII